MTRINTNVASLRGLRSLQNANKTLGTSLTRLSTGLQINNGKDNPSGLIASETLRSQVTTIEQSIKNSNRANNVISTADSALGEVGGLLNQIRGLVQEGLNEGALSQPEIEANQLQIDAALSAINRISANTTFAGDKLIDGSKGFTTQVTTVDNAKLSDFQINEAVFGSSATVSVDATITTAAEKGELRFSGASLTESTQLELSGSSGTEVLFLGASSSAVNISDAINKVTDVTGVQSTITNATAGTSDITSAGGNNDITLTDARLSQSQGIFAESVTVVFADPGANSSALGVASVAQDANNNYTITVNLETNGDGTIVSNATQVVAELSGNAEANVLVTASASEGDGSGVVAANAGVAVADGVDAVLNLTSSNFGADEFVEVKVLGGSFATTLDDDVTTATRDAGIDIGVRINGQAAQGKGLRAAVKTSSLDASLNFTSASNVVNENAVVTITGGGSLFQIGQEVSSAGQIGVGIEAVNTARLGGITGKLFELGSGGGKSLLDVGPSVPGADLVNIIEESITRVSNLRGRLGALQKNVIDTNISTLGVSLENIIEARSQIVDTDFAQETANLTRGQILSQAGISTLSIANQNPQQVLSLLG